MRAMVLCAGFGTRMGNLTREKPKPMLELNGRPLLEYIINHLARHGFREIAINLHFQPHIVCNYFGDGSLWNTSIRYSYEEELLGTAGGLRRMASFLRDCDLFVAHYGDILTDQDYSSMVAFHRAHRAIATVLIHERVRSNSVVTLDEEKRIIGFLERPTERERARVSSPWVNSGVYVCSPELLDEIPADAVYDIPRDLLPKVISTGRIYGFPLTGYRCAIDSPERLAEARSAVAEGRFLMGSQLKS
jgi:NDP-sugar pyrophosphorylase family protein